MFNGILDFCNHGEWPLPGTTNEAGMPAMGAYRLSYILDDREGRRPAALVKKMRLAANSGTDRTGR